MLPLVPQALVDYSGTHRCQEHTIETKVEFPFRLSIGSSFIRQKPYEVTNIHIPHPTRLHFHPHPTSFHLHFGPRRQTKINHFSFSLQIAVNVRSISALDTAAVQRARARQQYSTAARLKVTAGTASLRKSIHFTFHIDAIVIAFHTQSNELTFVRLRILLFVLFCGFLLCHACILMKFLCRRTSGPTR